MTIRTEEERDQPAVRAVNEAAFDTAAEAVLVDALRAAAAPLVSLVAEEAGEIVGHILFSPVALDDHPGANVMGLAPMAVAPSHQRRGIGSRLVRAGLEECRRLGAGAVVVLGHPGYYPRFGFSPAEAHGLRSEYDAPAGAFQVVELEPGVLRRVSGLVRYHPAFRDV